MYRLRLTLILFLSFFFVMPVGSAVAGDSLSIVINVPSRTLALYNDENLIREYPIAIGKLSTPTPLGNYKILNMEENPVWIPPGRDETVPSGPDNPLGYRWIEFYPTYGIHGTNAPWSIGTAASNGCIRMREADAEDLYQLVKVGIL